MLLKLGTGNGKRKTRNGERGTGNGKRETENRERRTGNRERRTGNGERGTGRGVWERAAVTRLRIQYGRKRKRKRINLGKCDEVLVPWVKIESVLSQATSTIGEATVVRLK